MGLHPSDTPVNGNGESFTDDGSATTLPSTTDLIVRDAGGVGSTSVAGRYDADAQKLYLQFSGLTADSALVDFANIQISDSCGSGKVINLDDVKVIKGHHYFLCGRGGLCRHYSAFRCDRLQPDQRECPRGNC